jgi:hypothetical protein
MRRLKHHHTDQLALFWVFTSYLMYLFLGLGLPGRRIQGGIDASKKPAARWRIEANPLVYV